MKKLLVALSMTAILAAPALARETLPWTNSEYPNPGDPQGGGCTLLSYDGDAFVTYGSSPGWGDEVAVTFEVPAGGPYTVSEVHYWGAGVSTLSSFLYGGGPGLFDPPTAVSDVLGSFSFLDAAPPASAWTVVAVAGPSVSSGDLVRPGLNLTSADAIGLADYLADGNPGHSWALFSGFWTDDTYAYGYDDGVRVCLAGGPTPTYETTWGKVKTLFE